MTFLLRWFSKHELIGATAALALYLAVVFIPVVGGDRTLMFSASTVSSIMPYGAFAPGNAMKPEPLTRSPDPAAPGWQTDPWVKYLHDQVFYERCFPLWNPFTGLGMPFLANMQSQPLNPLFWLPALGPSPMLMDLFVLLRLLVGGLFAYIFLRQVAGKLCSLIGAIGFMLTGYMVILMAMPEISVAITTPLVFFAYERLIRKPSLSSVTLTAIASALNLLGGMPELSALIMIFAGVYFLLRLLMLHRSLERKLRSCLGLAGASLLGLGLAAPQLLPFIEYMRQSFNSHDSSLGVDVCGIMYDNHLTWWPHVMSYVQPCKAGTFVLNINSPMPPDIRGYFGIVMSLLVLVTIITAITSRGGSTKRQKIDVQLITPFALFVIFALMKRFGSPLVNWVGKLPLFDMILFAKYDEPLMGFSVVVIATVGLRWILQKSTKPVDIIGGTLALAIPYAIWKIQEPHVFASKRAAHAYFYDVYFFAAVLLVSMLILLLARRTRRIAALQALILVVAAEMATTFIAPVFFMTNQLPIKTCNPYAGAPFVSFLQKNTQKKERVFGYDGFLFPSWSCAFGVFDLRALDALYVGRFLSFVRNFVNGDPGLPRDKETGGVLLKDNNAATRFSGAEKTLLYPTEIERGSALDKLFCLSSVRYLITNRFFMKPTPEMTQILATSRNIPEEYLKIRTDFFLPDGNKLCVLHQHPLGNNSDENRARLPVKIDKAKPFLVFSVGLDPRRPVPGDGANAFIKIKRQSEQDTLFAQFLEPNETSYKFSPHVLDLSRFAGQSVELEFSVDGGPKKDSLCDWVEWSGIHLVASKSETEFLQGANDCKMSIVYSGECLLFENPRALPRASLFRNIAIAKDGDDALKHLNEPGFDVHGTAVIEEGAFNDEEKQIIEKLDRTPVKVTEQEISRYSAHEVEILCDSQGGLLVLNDANYPGWTVLIDGHPKNLRNANFLFRGVFVTPGRHTVTFRYNPASFHLGLVLFGIAVVTLGVLALTGKSRRSRSTPRAVYPKSCVQ